jgi:hypothetical protein
MITLPVYDEKRREFVDTAQKTAPVERPRRMLTSALAKRPTSEPAEPPPPPEAGASKIDTFLQVLNRLQHSLDEAGNKADAAALGEIAEHLLLHRAEDDAADSEVKPIFAVAAAYIEALTAITSADEASAAQLLARKLVSLGYELPKRGGDTRGWKRLLLWRDRLVRRQLPMAMSEIYKRAFEFARHDLTHINLNAALEHAMARSQDGVAEGPA